MRHRIAVAAMAVSVAGACAGADNPTALSDLQPEVEFETSSTVVETFDEVDMHVQALHDGQAMVMDQAWLEVRDQDGNIQQIPLTADGEEYSAPVTFFRPGEHHVVLVGIPERHSISAELGEREIEVARKHVIIGSYWVEFEINPAPMLEGSEAHIHMFAYQLTPDSLAGAPVPGLALDAELHAPDGDEAALVVTDEGAGEYECQARFEHNGIYELHVTLTTPQGEVSEEIHLPVISPHVENSIDQGDNSGDTGGHGHGH